MLWRNFSATSLKMLYFSDYITQVGHSSWSQAWNVRFQPCQIRFPIHIFNPPFSAKSSLLVLSNHKYERSWSQRFSRAGRGFQSKVYGMDDFCTEVARLGLVWSTLGESMFCTNASWCCCRMKLSLLFVLLTWLDADVKLFSPFTASGTSGVRWKKQLVSERVQQLDSELPDALQKSFRVFVQFMANFWQNIFKNCNVFGNIDFSTFNFFQFIFYPHISIF